jgi:hypothetical protein
MLGITGLAAALLSPQWRPAGMATGFVFLSLAGTFFSHAAEIARSIRPFVRQSVCVEVWGQPLPESGEGAFKIDSISAFGAGLLIHLRAASSGPRLLLKVAQPRSARVEEDRIEISEAAYVSWAGKKLRPAAGKPMPALVLFTRPRVTLRRRRTDGSPLEDPVSTNSGPVLALRGPHGTRGL